MSALTPGAQAPDISLPTLDGGLFSLADALRHGPVVAAFLKISCPVCQYAFPFLERLHHAYKRTGVAIVGISQDDAKSTAAFNKQYGITFPTALDDLDTYLVSNAYSLTHVPSVFLISPEQKVEMAVIGWDKAEMLKLSHALGKATGAVEAELFRRSEDVAAFKAG